MIVSFLATPVIVSKLSISGYGAWEAVVSISVLCNILQASVAATLLWMVSTAFGSADTVSAQKYVRMATFFSIAVFIVVTPLIWIFRRPLAEFISLPENLQHAGLWLLPCVVGLALLGSINEIMNSFISGFQRSGAAALVQAGSVIGGNVAVIVLVSAGLGHLGMLIGYTLTIVIAFCGLFLVARRIVPSFTVRPMLPSRQVLHKCAPFAAFMVVGVLASVFREQGDKLVMAATASPAWSGYYGIAARLASLVLVVCGFLYVPTMAAVGAVSGAREPDHLNRVYDDVSTMNILSVGLAVAIIGGLSDRLVILWIGHPIPEVEQILLIMLGGIALAAMLTGGGTAICKGLGILHIELKYIVLSLAANIALKILLVPFIGPLGSVIASYASWGLASLVFIVLFHRATGVAPGPSFRLAGAVAIGLVCIVLARYANNAIAIGLGVDRLGQVPPIVFLATAIAGTYVALSIATGVIPRDAVRSLAVAARTMARRLKGE